MITKKHTPVALVTGASSGIGADVARELASRGYHVALCARRKDRLENLKKDLEKKGVQALPLSCDVTQEASLKKAVDETVKAWGRLDLVVANAGFAVSGALEKLTIEDYRRQFETNIFGVLHTIYACLEELKKTKGSIGIVGSVAGHIPFALTTPYTMSKHALKALSFGLWHEFQKYGVSVTLLSPGYVQTEIFQVDKEGMLHEKPIHSIPEFIKMPSKKAAQKIVQAIIKRKREKIVTLHGWLFKTFYGLFPRTVNGFLFRSTPQ